jgi:hypothetical protein
VQRQIKALQSGGAVQRQALAALRLVAGVVSAPVVGVVAGVLSLLGLLHSSGSGTSSADEADVDAPPSSGPLRGGAQPLAAAADATGTVAGALAGRQVDIRETRRARQLQPVPALRPAQPERFPEAEPKPPAAEASALGASPWLPGVEEEAAAAPPPAATPAWEPRTEQLAAGGGDALGGLLLGQEGPGIFGDDEDGDVAPVVRIPACLLPARCAAGPLAHPACRRARGRLIVPPAPHGMLPCAEWHAVMC